MTNRLYKTLPITLALLLTMAVSAPGHSHAGTGTIDETAIEATHSVAFPDRTEVDETTDSVVAPPLPDPTVIIGAPEPIVPPPAHKMNVALDWYLTPYHAALIVARERGLFMREGLDVTLSPPADPTVPPKLVAAQHAELALTSQPRLHLLVEQGLPLIRVGTLVPAPLATLLVREDSGITSLSQLKGKTIGYVFETSARLLLDGMLESRALTSSDMTLQRTDFALTRSLAEGKVDAVMGALRHVSRQQMEQEGIDVIEFPLGENDAPRYDELILVANRDTLKQHRRDIARFLDALEKATLWLINHPEQAWELVSAAEPGLDTEANARAWPDTLRYLALRPAALQMQRYQDFETYLLQHGLIETLTPARQLATDLTSP